MKFDRILFVCLGNICRSPMAEAIFKSLIPPSHSDLFKIDSAGTSGEHAGELPDPRAMATLKKNNIPFQHRARKFTPGDFTSFDLIIVMDQSNYQWIQKMIPKNLKNPPEIKMMCDFDEANSGKDVVDPWYGDISDFNDCYKTLYICSQHLFKYVYA